MSFHYGNYGKIKSPCAKDCPNRKAGCVTDCEALHEYEARKRALYDKRLGDVENYRMQRDLARRRWEKTLK